MEKFSIEEINLMCIYDTGTRAGLIEELKGIMPELTIEDEELAELIQMTIKKLAEISDQEYRNLILIPDFKEEDEL